MIVFNANDSRMAPLASELLQDHCLECYNEYDEDDLKSAKKLGKLRRGLLITGDAQTHDEAEALLRKVVMSEMENWVADASQRLINRACGALGFMDLLDSDFTPDHGGNPGDHALVQDWVMGIFVLRCCTCARLFKI